MTVARTMWARVALAFGVCALIGVALGRSLARALDDAWRPR